MSGPEQRVVHGSVGDDLVSDDGHDRREHQDDQGPGMNRPVSPEASDGVSTLSGRDGFVQRSELPLLVPGPGLRLSRAVLASNGGGELYVDTLKNKRARTVPPVPIWIGGGTHYERVQYGMVADDWSRPVLEPASLSTASDGQRRPTSRVRGHVGGIGLRRAGRSMQRWRSFS